MVLVSFAPSAVAELLLGRAGPRKVKGNER